MLPTTVPTTIRELDAHSALPTPPDRLPSLLHRENTIVPLLLVALLAIAPTPSWPRYSNVRYGYSLCHPPSFRGAREADAGDGRVFSDGVAELRVHGGYDDAASPTRALAGELSTLSAPQVTYRAGRGMWAVASGLARGRVFYVKAVARGDRVVVLALSYPASAAARYDSTAASIGRCLSIGAAPF